MRFYLSWSAVLLFSLSFVGCAARQSVPVGQIPLAEAPSQANVKQTSYAIHQNFRKEGVGLRQSGTDYQRVQNIVLRLESAAGIQNFNFPIYIADSVEDVNAMAVNGNTIVVYRELPKRVPSDDELATVLSHEVAHILAKHHEDDSSEKRSSILSIGSSILGAAAAIGAAYAGAGSAGVDLAGDLTATATNVVGLGAFVRSYDRDLEREADHVGLMLMAKAGFDPSAAIRFWSKAEEIFGHGSSFSFLSTHPSSDDRVDQLKDALPVAMRYYEAQKGSPIRSNRMHEPSGNRKSIQLLSAGGMRINAAHPLPHAESQLYLAIESAYMTRGYDREIAGAVVRNLRNSLAKVPEDQRQRSLQQVLKQLQGNP